MKKLIALLLVIMMCLSLVGCNAGAAKYAKYMTIINALEEKDYEGAVEEIYQMYLEDEGVSNTGNATDDENESSEVVTEVTAEYEMWVERAPGEYMGYNYDEAPVFESIILNEDYTCTIDGTAYTWDFEKNWDGSQYNCYETYTYVQIFEGETQVYEFSMSLDEKDYVYAYLYTVDADGATSSTDGYFYNMSDLEIIELTVDNWQNYFEEVEIIETNTNSFDEITSFNIYKYYLLKEQYGHVIDNLSDVAIEFTRTEVRQTVTVDLEKGTYEWGAVDYTYDPYTSTTEMYNQWIDDEPYYGFAISSTYVDEFPEDQVYRYITFEMNRLKGTIYCVPVK